MDIIICFDILWLEIANNISPFGNACLRKDMGQYTCTNTSNIDVQPELLRSIKNEHRLHVVQTFYTMIEDYSSTCIQKEGNLVLSLNI